MIDSLGPSRRARKVFPDGAWEFDPERTRSYRIEWKAGDSESLKRAIEDARRLERECRMGNYMLLDIRQDPADSMGFCSETRRFIPCTPESLWIPCACAMQTCTIHS